MDVSLEFVSASSVDAPTRVDLFNVAYGDYFVPFHIDEPALAYMVDAWDFDLDRSFVAFSGEQPTGFANLALRDGVGWIGGVGVIPEARRGGLARTLMEMVIEQAPGDVLLEVIEQNEPARELYLALGFMDTRLLDVWSWAGDTPPSRARLTKPRLIENDAPWQRARPKLDDLAALECDNGLVLFRPGEVVSVVQFEADDVATAVQLLAGAKAHATTLSFVNAPGGGTASQALHDLGAELRLRQFEMRLSRPTA